MPYFLYSNTITPSSNPVGNGYSPPEKKDARFSRDRGDIRPRQTHSPTPPWRERRSCPRFWCSPSRRLRNNPGEVCPSTIVGGKSPIAAPLGSARPASRPMRNPNRLSPGVLNASQLKPRSSVTDRCTSAIWTSRLTCCAPAIRNSFSTRASFGSAAAASRDARSDRATEPTSPVRATPRATRRARTACRPGSLPSIACSGSRSRTTDKIQSWTRPASPITATEVRPTVLPMTYNTPGDRSCTSATLGSATSTDDASPSTSRRRPCPITRVSAVGRAVFGCLSGFRGGTP